MRQGSYAKNYSKSWIIMKINILHLNSNYSYTQLHQCMLEKLDLKEGIKNQVFMPSHDKNLGVVKTNENVFVCECFNKVDRLFFDLKQQKIYKAVKSNFNVEMYNLIHAYTLFTDGNCARKLSKKHGIPYVVAVRNTDVNAFFKLMPHLRGRGIKTMLDASAVFFLSESYRNQVFEKYVPKKHRAAIEAKTHIIPNGIDDFWFDNLPDKKIELKEPIKLLFAGRIDRNKNVPTIQKAMQILHERGYDLSLTVVGRVIDQNEFGIISSDKHTQCISAKPKEELIDLYRDHHIFVMPSFTESFGLVYVEAMSQGLPVIYSKGQGFDGQFPEGQVGYSVYPHDAEDVADGIEKIIKNFDTIKGNVVESAKKFNWTEISEVYDKIYKSIK